MQEHKNKKILLGVSGGIAAYKACEIVSELSKLGIETQSVLTKNASEFISPLSLETLSHKRCYSDQFSYDLLTPLHIELARIHDLLLIAPATANIIAKIAHGICDDLLSSLACAFPKEKKILIAPAMNTHMWKNPVVQKNIKILQRELNVQLIEPDYGELACQTTGVGKLASVKKIISELKETLYPKEQTQILKGKEILITLGGFQEKIDPVRFIGNRSSGKMGLAVAKAAYQLGAQKINLISGNQKIKELDREFFEQVEASRLEISYAQTFTELESLLTEKIKSTEILVMAAAVPDFRIKNYQEQKIKGKEISLELEKNPDLLKKLSKLKSPTQKMIGFAAETENLKENAQRKLKEKNLDLIVANDVSNSEIGFESDLNEVYLFTREKEYFLEKKTKSELAREIWGIFSYL